MVLGLARSIRRADIYQQPGKAATGIRAYDVSHQSAYKPEQSIPTIPAKSVPALRQEPEINIGFGLRL